MRLRGLCTDSAVDKYYQPMNDLSAIDFLKDVMFVGLKRSTIKYDEKNKNWNMSTAWTKVSGISNASHNTFLLGKHEWSISGDKGCKTNGEEYTVHLKLTGCNATGHFTCDDGQCVTTEQRCNQLPECRDHSDEKNCKILNLGDGYNKNIPPFSVEEMIVSVNVSIDLLKLVDIDEADYSIEIQYSIFLKWQLIKISKPSNL